MDSSVAAPRTIKTGSFSRLNVFEGCEHHAFLEFVLKEPKPIAAAENKGGIASARGNAIHTGAEKFIQGEGVLIDELQKPVVKERVEAAKEQFAAGTAIVEQEWGFTNDWTPTGYYADDVWLRVKCDFVNYDAGLKRLDIEDWKSGKRWGNEVKHAQQGVLYGITGLIKYPDAEKVGVRFTYSDEGTSKPRDYTRTQIMQLMPSWHGRLTRMTTATRFKPKPNKINCRWCPYGPNNGGNRKCQYGVEV